MRTTLKPTISLLLALALLVSQPATVALGQLCGDDRFTNCRPGDANGDGLKGITDAVYIIQYVFNAGIAPRPYSVCSGDYNGDGLTNISDAVAAIAYIFNNGPRPFYCYEWESTGCGTEFFPPGNGTGCTNPGDYDPGPWGL